MQLNIHHRLKNIINTISYFLTMEKRAREYLKSTKVFVEISNVFYTKKNSHSYKIFIV